MCPGARWRRLVGDVEFLALLIWLLLAGAGTILAPFAVTTPGAGLSFLAAGGGLTVCVLYIVLDAPLWAGWVQLGLAALGILGAGLAAAQLLDDRVVSGSVGEEVQAGVVGLQLPFYFAVTFVTLLIALQATDPVV
jgi:hypothetical protein